MSVRTQTKLSPLERAARNSLVIYLATCGYNINSISRIMNMTQSTASRAVQKGEFKTIIEIITGK